MRVNLLKYLGLVFILTLAPKAMPGHAVTTTAAEDDSARSLLTQAMENQYHGRYQATLELVNENFSDGRDSLAGWAEFSDDVGERKICLSGPNKAFEYRSLNYGKEQWIMDDQSKRIRRIANRQWKKGMFGNLLTYEDMLKLPSDFFLEYASCKGVKAVDSGYQVSMTLKQPLQSLYSRLDVTLSKTPVLLRSLTFYGPRGERLKTMEVGAYKQMEGKWLVTDLCVADNDSLSSVRMCFRNFSFTDSAALIDHAKNLSLASKRPLIIPPGTAGDAKESDDDASEEVSN
jgi:hypothetical protein